MKLKVLWIFVTHKHYITYSKLSGISNSDFNLQTSRALKFSFEGVHLIAKMEKSKESITNKHFRILSFRICENMQ